MLLQKVPCLNDLAIGSGHCSGRRAAFLNRASAAARVIGNGWIVQSCSLLIEREVDNDIMRYRYEDERDTSSVTSLNEFRDMVAQEPMDVVSAWIYLCPPV